MKIKKYIDFLLEYEGGPPTKDSIKVSDRMITNINLNDDGEEEEDKDIPILSDINESDHNDVDPFGEEDWDDVEYSYIDWKGSLYDFLKQLNNSQIKGILVDLPEREKVIAHQYIKDILDILEYDLNFSDDELIAVEKDIDELEDLCINDEDPHDNPDYWYDMDR